jgi:hypothetical protein
MVNTPSAAITTTARKRFISVPFQKQVGLGSSPAGTVPAGSKKIRARSVPALPVPCLRLGSLSLPHAPKIFRTAWHRLQRQVDDLPMPLPPTTKRPLSPGTKKADVAEHPKAFDHVGLLFNKPPDRVRLFFI